METHFGEIEQASSSLVRERVLLDLNTLARDTDDLLQATAHGASDKVREALSRVTAALEQAKATCLPLPDQAVATAKAAARKTNVVIRQHPHESMGIAFGLGLLIGPLAVQGSRHGRDSTRTGEHL